MQERLVSPLLIRPAKRFEVWNLVRKDSEAVHLRAAAGARAGESRAPFRLTVDTCVPRTPAGHFRIAWDATGEKYTRASAGLDASAHVPPVIWFGVWDLGFGV
jgi:hypothetical protein